MIKVYSREYPTGCHPDFMLMYKWCATQCMGRYELLGRVYGDYNRVYDEFTFDNKDDAMRFKLVWG